MTNPTKPGGGKNRRPGSDSPAKAAAAKATGTRTTPDAGTATASKAGTASKAETPSKAGSAAAARTGKPAPNRAQSKKIVNKRQTPWGLIITTVLIVALAVGVIFYAVHAGTKKSTAGNPDKIKGIIHKTFSSGDHKNGVITYAESPDRKST